MRRRTLIYVVVEMGASIAVAAAYTLGASWHKNARAESLQLTVDLSDVPIGAFKVLDRVREKIYILRRAPDDVVVLSVQEFKSALYLPHPDAIHTWGPCSNFGPENTDGVLIDGAVFRCLDSSPDAGGLYSYRWSLDGRSLDPPSSESGDLSPVPFTRFGNSLVLRRASDF